MKPHTLRTWSLRTLKIAFVFLFMFCLVAAKPQASSAAPSANVKAQIQDGIPKGLDDYIVKSMRDLQVPGLAIAIVKDDKVVLAKGYGQRKVGEATPVTKDTVFALGSTTKAFTAAALAILVDEGKIKWDDPVIKHLPGFRLKDPYVTRKITVRDLLSHRTGLERHELIWLRSGLSREQLLSRLQHADLTRDFRTEFSYQNILYLAAGQIIPAVTGKSWGDFVTERIFKPLGMNSSSTSFKTLARMNNVARPHDKMHGKVQTTAGLDLDNVGPAGSINSTVVDMAHWLRFQLGQGSYNKQRLLTTLSFQEMHTSQIVIRMPAAFGHFRSYGLGWFLQDYRGQKLVEHGGNVDGMTAQVALVPEKKLGVVLLSNMNVSQLPAALMYRIVDAYLAAPERDWSGEAVKMEKLMEKSQKDAITKADKERVRGTKPSLLLPKYAGSFANNLYGEIKIVMEKDKLIFRYGTAFIGDMEHWNHNTFQIKWRNLRYGNDLVSFNLDNNGKVEEIKCGFGGLFKRIPDKAQDAPTITVAKSELQKFLGSYRSENPSAVLSIELIGTQLKAVMAGAPPATLLPVKANRFKLQDKDYEIFLDFDLADGKVKSMTLTVTHGPKITFLPKK